MSERRFGGIVRLYGEEVALRFASSHVVVVGVGGVGSWAVEALARSGIGRLTLIDMDHVAESNINRQLAALESTLGRSKIETLRERVRDIDPACEVSCTDDFVTPENLDSLLPDADWIMDCIDSARVKSALIAHCRRRSQAVITAGAAGGQKDPTRIRVTDLRRTEHDALLARTRRQLRQHYGFPSNPKRSMGVPAVWSNEPVHRPVACETASDGSLNCAGYGSCMPVTAGMGLAAAAHVLQRLAADA
jgi:tRNA A37 threonylcarbamoyladenosine dehydratase